MPVDREARTDHGEVPEAASRVFVDPARCIGSGICLATAPGYFEPAENHRSRARPGAPVPDESAADAAALCPVEAIGFLASGPSAHPPPPHGSRRDLTSPPSVSGAGSDVPC
ncbi:ferredoxin [Streptomyces sp. McG3]|uniref:ferredoxin n=1 Tax=Streptomyces sp. McG3 TaxID=2725483 RepID=UPI001BEAEE94|nr:ferredoxin [Streptomyces sp. McG3]MBT2901850.1 ferredoxin [Streptomyces sp. McG3]